MDKSGAYSIHDKADTFANIFDIFFSNPALNSSKESTVTLARTVNKKTLKSSNVIPYNSALRVQKKLSSKGTLFSLRTALRCWEQHSLFRYICTYTPTRAHVSSSAPLRMNIHGI